MRGNRTEETLQFVERIEPSGEAIEDAEVARLVTRFQSGDTEVFTDLYRLYFDRVYGYLRTMLADRHEAEDVAQQVFMVALEKLPQYERRSQPFRAWLFIVVRNRAVSHLRKQGRIDVTDPENIHREDDGNGNEPELSVLDWISDQDLMVLIERLPIHQRQVLALRYMLDLKVHEIADVMGRRPNDVSQLQHRALGFLRQRLTALGRAPAPGRRSRTRVRTRQALVLRARRYALHL